jgi:hypothetical protein
MLWSPAGRPGLAELHRRGLRDQTIRRARLGWNPGHIFDEPARWGFTGGRKVSVPKGLIIPWSIGDALWRIRVRRLRPDPDPKGTPYYSPRVYPTESAIPYPYDHEALYNAGALTPGKPAIILEGEFDCLSVAQAAGDLVTPVATGSVSGSRRLRWLARLARCSPVLVGFDADVAGDREARYWLQILPEARRWRPFWEDANRMARDGVDLRAWITAGIPDPLVSRWPITVRWPASYPPQAMPPTWRYLADGRIEAVYYTYREMEFSLQTLGLVRTALALGGVCLEEA